jgi:hypothetical protein
MRPGAGAGGTADCCRHGAVLIAGALEDEVRERLGAVSSLGRSVAREVVERSVEDGAYVELSHKVDGRGRPRGSHRCARLAAAIGRQAWYCTAWAWPCGVGVSRDYVGRRATVSCGFTPTPTPPALRQSGW